MLHQEHLLNDPDYFKLYSVWYTHKLQDDSSLMKTIYEERSEEGPHEERSEEDPQEERSEEG